MTVAEDIVRQVERLAQALPLPAVRALHLPPPSTDGTREGEFCAIELEDGSIGLSFVLLGEQPGAVLRELRARDTSTLKGTAALALARVYAEHQGSERTLGFASINAITRCLFDRARFRPPAAQGSIGDLDLKAGDHLGMIGLFPPLVPRVLASGARLTVLELRADLAGPRDGWHVTLDPAALAGCNKILSTSTVLLNDTLDDLLARCRHAERIALIGPGASCLPDALFARGVTMMGGTWIDDADGFKRALAEGEPWGGFATKFALGRESYPGLDRLCALAAGQTG
ncbi:MAG: Rossmann-like domain-containing protein [Gemmatimonadota bacterium]